VRHPKALKSLKPAISGHRRSSPTVAEPGEVVQAGHDASYCAVRRRFPLWAMALFVLGDQNTPPVRFA
jgi:hypothetical protein